MKTIIQKHAIALLATMTLAACGGGDNASPMGNGGPAFGLTTSNMAAADNSLLNTSLAALPIGVLSAAEKESLAYMREEEKLAHDVYSLMDTLWGSRTFVFGNITRSESFHTEAMRQLLLRYALPDPALNLAAGSFQETKLQALYTQLVAAGNLSLVDALKVGAAIEEIDMIDIDSALLSVTSQDIRLVYNNLYKGSQNHLRAFVNALSLQGITYVPQYMSPAQYASIVNGTN